MLELTLLAVGCLFGLWFVCRCLAWLVCWIVKHTLKVDLHIGKIGFFTLGHVCLTLRNGFSVEVERLWLSSSFINSDIRKPLAICVNDVRVQLDLPEKSSRSVGSQHQVGQHGLPVVFSYVQFIGLVLDNVHIILVRGLLPGCMTHLTVQEVVVDWTIDYTRDDTCLDLLLQVKNFSTRVFCSSSHDGASVPCIAEVTLSHALYLRVDTHTANIQVARLTVEKPHILITEGLVNQLQQRQQSGSGQFTSDNQSTLVLGPSWSPGQNLDSFSQYIPEVQKSMSRPEPSFWSRKLSKLNRMEVYVQLEDSEVTLLKESSQRRLAVNLRDVLVHFKKPPSEGAMAQPMVLLTVKDAIAGSSQVKVACLTELKTTVKVDDSSMTITSKIQGGFLGYHHEELQYWLTVVSGSRRLTPSQAGKGPDFVRSERNVIVDIVGQRLVTVIVEIEQGTLSIATATCAGLKGGVDEAKLTFSFSVNHRESTDIRGEAEVMGLYWLIDGATSPENFTSKQHHWGNVLYLGILIAKIRRLSDDVIIESMLDSVQVEWSSSFAGIVSQFLHAVTRGHCLALRDPMTTTGQNNDILSKLNVSRINIQCSSINAYVCSDYNVGTMVRVDSLVCHQRSGELTFKCVGTKMVYFQQSDQSQAVARSHDIHDYCGHLEHLAVTYTVSARKVSVEVCEEVYLVWTTTLHMCLFMAVQDVRDLSHKLQGVGEGRVVWMKPLGVGKRSTPSPSHIIVSVRANCMLALQLSKQHRLSFSMPEMKVETKGAKTSASIPQASISCDEHEIFTFENAMIQSLHHSAQIQMDREGFSVLDLPTNRAWGVTFDRIAVIFPHQYNFADCFEEIINLNKWRKLVHKVVKPPFTADSPLPPDLVIKAQSVTLQLSDDPFEVRLSDNYELLSDESVENEKRQYAMDKRIQELRKKYGLLPASKIGELYASLSRKAAEVYIQRSRQMYVASPRRTKLFTWSMTNIEITALADSSLHGKENVVKHMRSIDKDSPYPEEGLEFTTLWCRMVNVSTDKLLFNLRDFAMPLMEIESLHLWGRLVGAEQAAAPRAQRTGVVEVDEPWGNVNVVRFMPSLKFYHDFSCDVKRYNIAYGPCWEPTFAQYNLAQNLIQRPSVDPSQPLPFWDKARLLLHGRLTMSVAKMRWIYHVSLDPYNMTELMDWTWSNLILDWANAKWELRGDLDIYARTASKYDDCNLLHLPNLCFCVRLDWVCRGDANDHHAVMQCAPDKQPEYCHQDHDSFRAFRSQNLNMSVSFETKEGKDPNDLPRCHFYGSTLRWMDKIKLCFGRISRPIRRGQLFKLITPRKRQLSRHLKDTELSVSLHGFQVQYWVSFARQHGVEMKGGALSLGVGAHLNLVPVEDGLIHRLQADWSIRHFCVQLEHTTIWLVSANPDGEEGVSLRGPVNKNYFLSVEKVMYHRDDPLGVPAPQSPGEVEENTVHKVQIFELKGAWTPSNRNIAFSLYDGYSKSQNLKKNLSSDALKGFKVDSSQTPTYLQGTMTNVQKNRSMSMTSPRSLSVVASPSPMSKIQAGPAYSMLQKLVSEADSRFVAVNEEVSGGSVQVDQLHGIQACQTDDVLKRNWLIELYNSQVMLRGKETAGYVIVSAGKASILSQEHQPVWRERQPRSKTTWVGCLEFMQYYATVDPSASTCNDKVLWLNKENIEYVEDHSDGAGLAGMPEMIGSGQSVGGVVNDSFAEEGGSSVQLQRIISRCMCKFFYAHFGEADRETYPEVPPPPADDSDMMKQEEGVNSFTLVHHDLNICTNSLQYEMILDIVNNLLLHVESRKKVANEKLQKMRFQLALSSGEDQKKPILQRQNMLRQLLSNMRRLERELYMVHKALEEEPSNDELLDQSHELEIQLYKLKTETMAVSQELALMISCFKENQLQVKAQRKAAKESKTVGAVVRRNEVCFKHAEWRMTEADGQIGIADLVLRDFLYSKLNRSDDSGAHQLELGWVKVTNLLRNSLYKDVLVPQDVGRGHSHRQMALRILCKFKAPVGGIAVQEHFEVNVVPISIQLTYQFYKTVMGFFFPGRNIDVEDTQTEDGDGEVSVPPTPAVPPKSRKKTSIKQKVLQRTNSDDIDKMKERAEQNNMFLYCKIPEVPMRLSYKGEKDKNIEDAYDLSLLLPTLEYHNETWTWLDFLLAVKKDSKRILIQQAIKQKLHVRSRGGATEEPKSEGRQEEDKVKMLLGAKLLSGGEKPHSKKSLFGKSNTK